MWETIFKPLARKNYTQKIILAPLRGAKKWLRKLIIATLRVYIYCSGTNCSLEKNSSALAARYFIMKNNSSALAARYYN